MEVPENSSPEQLVESLGHLKVAELKELSESLKELTGLWELSKEGTDAYAEQLGLAKMNAELASRVQQKVATVLPLRERASLLNYSLSQKHAEWLSMEQEMHNSIAPFSTVGVTERLRKDLKEVNDFSESLKDSFLDSNGADVLAFIKEYRKQRESASLKELKLRGLS